MDISTCKCGKEMFLYLDSDTYNVKRWLCPHCKSVLSFYKSNNLVKWSTAEEHNIFIEDLDVSEKLIPSEKPRRKVKGTK